VPGSGANAEHALPFQDPCTSSKDSILEREHTMTLRQWLNHSFLTKRRTATRRPAGGFAADHWAGATLKHDVIRDISATGVYLLTRAVRCGEDGVGLAFDIPEGVEPRLWINLVETAPTESSPDDIVGPFKMAKALAFLSRISRPSGSAVRQEIRTKLNGQRLWNAIEIALQAESLLASCPEGNQLHGCPSTVIRILHDGSWADDDSIQQCWAGLLATACKADDDDESNRAYIDIFSQLSPTHIRLVTAACTKATKFVTESGIVAARQLTCSTGEIMKLFGTRDLLRMGRALEHLSGLGLLEERFKTSLFIPVDGINITPTCLGLQLYACCNGHRGEPQTFYGAESSSTAAVAE
jgi:hypothetical protein